MFKLQLKSLVPRPYQRFVHRRFARNILPVTNIYHCCTQKTASQWFQYVFGDRLFFLCTGLEVEAFTQTPRTIQDTVIDEPLPKWSVGTTLYVEHPTYQSIPKTGAHRAFFVLRDPRDILVCWYFPVMHSHCAEGRVGECRRMLQACNQKNDGLKIATQFLVGEGLFEAQRSWLRAQTEPTVKIFRYEDLAQDNAEFLASLFDFLGIQLSPSAFERLKRRHAFENYSQGGKQGESNLHSHYRRGVAGDWINYFDRELCDHFERATKNLVEELGYH